MTDWLALDAVEKLPAATEAVMEGLSCVMKLLKMAVMISTILRKKKGRGGFTHKGSKEFWSLFRRCWTEISCLICSVESCGDRVLVFPAFASVVGVSFGEPV